ncbi:hypothetical protein QN277_028561 [Acacia crassicarpa]|uniref:Uncharacterized protein n=1 Tax=Acacia crassicarpa TaxID=499986 RepID=A0AAE1K182_9FABA|nr:hypothetical protein QN277_028561 [Acacia crassicarpa]
MDKAYEELDDAKAEIERLKTELRSKADSLENLKQFQNAQVNQIQEAKLKNEKLEQDVLQKEDIIIEAKQNCEDLKGDLHKKESIIKHLSAANDKLRGDCDAKCKKWEDEKKGLVLALEEAVEKAENQDQQIHVYRQEIESLKGCLSASKRPLEVEKKSEANEELRKSDDILHNLEDENKKVAEQLKWKKEQFKHLEEAHEKLREQFRSSKKEWELEKSLLLDEISSLETKLDSQIRISDNLQNQLQMCSQALAHEESRRKRLEVQVSDYKERFENVSSDYENARFELDQFNSQRDTNVGDMRYTLQTKEAHCKELKYTIQKLEQENNELRVSLKEFQEAQIQEAGASFSQSKLRSKTKSLGNIHRDCASTLQAKEAEWKLQIEKMTGELNGYRFELENKKEAIEELKMELEKKTEAMEELKRELKNSHSLTMELDFLKEEMSLLLLILKQEISEARMKLVIDKEEMDLFNKEREDKRFELMKQLETKNAALIEAQKYIKEELDLINKEREEKCSELMNLLEMKDSALTRAQQEITEEREKAARALKAVDSLSANKEQLDSLQNELDRYKEMLDESTKRQHLLKEKNLQMENDSREKLKEVSDALDTANTELDEKLYEVSEMEYELQIWMSIVERLKNELEENHVMRKELENSLLAQVDFDETIKQEKDSLMYKLQENEEKLEDLQKQVILVEQTAVSSETEKSRYLQIIEEKDKILEELQNEVLCLQQESRRGEFDHEKKLDLEILMHQAASLGHQFSAPWVSFSSQLAEKQAEINLVQDACDKITAAEIIAILENEEKKLMIAELEDDIRDLEHKLKLQEERWSQSEQVASEIEAEMEMKQLTLKGLTDQIETRLKSSDASYHKLKMENRNLLENVSKLLSEREKLLGFIMGLEEKICEFSTTDTRLMDKLGSSIAHSFENDCPGMNISKEDEFLTKENIKMHSPVGTKNLEVVSDARSPFKELNN